jgi:hypothetical protein
MMKYVEFYDFTSGEQETVGEVRLIDGVIEFSNTFIKKFLSETAVYYGGKVYWPTDEDKDAYLRLLPYVFSGSYFRASKVQER